MGDSVFSLYIRKHFIMSTDKKNAELNKCVNAIVCATNQAKLMEVIAPMLDDIEQKSILKVLKMYVLEK